MKKKTTISQALAMPLKISQNIIEKDLPVTETLKAAEQEGLLDKYKGPYLSNTAASYILDDTITVQCFNESKQPDGRYLITYLQKYHEKYKMSLYVRVLTSGIKRTLKYHKYPAGTKLHIKGDLDMYVCDSLYFDSDNDSLPDKKANVAVVITVIDVL